MDPKVSVIVPVHNCLPSMSRAGLLEQKVQDIGGAKVYITRLGETALAEGDARGYLS